MSEYYYLLSSLPTLREGEPPPFAAAEFLRRCADWLTPEAMAELVALELLPPVGALPSSCPTIAAWHDWETDLRNRLAQLRQPAAERDPALDLRPVGPCFPDNERALREALAAATPLERERQLDRLRWRRLDELEIGWSFGFDRLCVYKLKLLLAEGWQRRTAEAGRLALAGVTAGLHRQTAAVLPAPAA